MKRKLLLLVALLALVGVGAALADGVGFRAKTSRFNPGSAPVSDASSWVRGAGVPGTSSDQGLVLLMSAIVPYPPGASADATITPVKGVVLTSLGLDHLIGTYCTNGSPRWDVETTNGGVYGVGCASGTHTIAGMPAGWERITFSNADFQTLSGPAWGGFGSAGAKLTFLQVLQDEAGVSVLDNLQINGAMIGGAGGNHGENGGENGGENDD